MIIPEQGATRLERTRLNAEPLGIVLPHRLRDAVDGQTTIESRDEGGLPLTPLKSEAPLYGSSRNRGMTHVA